MASTPLRVGFVTGVTPDKWARTWRERRARDPLLLVPVAEPDQRRLLDDGSLDACLVRLPIEHDGLHVVPLYVERPVVVVPTDHAVTAYDEIDVGELADEPRVPATDVARAVARVADGDGVLVVPQSLARLHARRDVAHRFLTGVEGTQVALAWLMAADDDRIQAFVGVLRGRTAHSSRG